MSKVIAHLRAQWMGALALLIALGTGGAYAADTVFSTDIVDGEVKAADIDNNAVVAGKIRNGHVGNLDLAADAVDSSKVLLASLTGADVSNSSLTGDDVSNSSLTGLDISNSTLTGSDIFDESLRGTEISDESLGRVDLDHDSVTTSELAENAVFSSNVGNNSLTTDDVAGASVSGSISVSALANGRCTTFSGSVSGAQPGDAAILTTNGSIPNGMVIYAQRALIDAVHIKVCNLSGAPSAAISGIPTRVVTFR